MQSTNKRAPSKSERAHIERKEEKQLADLAMTCSLACVSGQATVTISTRGKCPAGFPRGELLSVGTNGAHNYACHPVKVLAWLHSRTCKTPNVADKRPVLRSA